MTEENNRKYQDNRIPAKFEPEHLPNSGLERHFYDGPLGVNRDVTLCSLVGTNVSDEPSASIFRL